MHSVPTLESDTGVSRVPYALATATPTDDYGNEYYAEPDLAAHQSLPPLPDAASSEAAGRGGGSEYDVLSVMVDDDKYVTIAADDIEGNAITIDQESIADVRLDEDNYVAGMSVLYY